MNDRNDTDADEADVGTVYASDVERWEAADQEVRRLKRDPALRRLARRMAEGVEPVLVHRLWTGLDQPCKWFTERMRWYWRRRQSQAALEFKESPARAVIALYLQQRERQ